MFHSKCILDWFAFQQRCPLCNEHVSNSLQRPAPLRAESPGLPLDFRRRFDDRRDICQRVLRFLGVDTDLARGSREIRDAPPADRPLRADVGDIFCPSASNPEQDRFQSSPDIGHELHQQDERESSEHSRASGTNSTSSDTNKWQQRSKGPRTYSYIVHDNVRMEMNARIPV
ncbi:hypothetical protein FGB62_21g411 [Gracilaria domingensis]|nr:hypothetical protein FGB62_21g411 [Gracilaria domingensis]